MAKYFLLVKIFSRVRGSRVTRAAAYRAGERIRDERTSESYNYSNRRDIVHTEIILPSGLASRLDMEWARDRATLWNTVEDASDRRNSRLAREVLVTLPPELTPAQRTNLVRTFSQELAEKYRSAVDFAVHEPRAGSDPRHHHAHVLMTTREVTPEGLGPRTTLDLSGRQSLQPMPPSACCLLLSDRPGIRVSVRRPCLTSSVTRNRAARRTVLYAMRITFVRICTGFHVLLHSDSVARLRCVESKVTQGERNDCVATMQARLRHVQR